MLILGRTDDIQRGDIPVEVEQTTITYIRFRRLPQVLQGSASEEIHQRGTN